MPASDEALIQAAQAHFPWRPYRAVRLPESPASNSSRSSIFEVDALFTSDGAPPRWDNLGLIVHRVRTSQDSLAQWRQRLVGLPVPGVLLAENDNAHLLLSIPGKQPETAQLPAGDRLPAALATYAPRFAPRDVAAFRTGQLSFVDTAARLLPGTIEFASRHRAELHEALKNAIAGAMSQLPGHHGAMREPVFRFALAYLGARILEDKGFFATGGLATPFIDDPRELLTRTVAKTNGFFKIAFNEVLPQLEKHPKVLQALVAYLGSATTFALIDQHDVGRLYELLIDALRNDEIGAKVGREIRNIAKLQQHYTPMALTERILARLPLERIRPENRIIFDPTAGSGSFLLAATQRLAAMTDLPEDPRKRRSYLESHVVGNDIDPHVRDIAFLRYCLVQESERSTDAFPKPKRFTNERYQSLTRENLGFRPSIVVANPPYGEEGAEQEAARFVQRVLGWLDDGAQFAFVLPQTFLIQSTHGIGKARRALSYRNRILEVWQIPEGTVGMSAQQDVCVVMGIKGEASPEPSVARAVFSRAEAGRMRTEGTLGASWLVQVTDTGDDWAATLMPPVLLSSSLPVLGDVFHVFTGPTPAIGEKPTSSSQAEEAKPYFVLEGLDGEHIWADPDRRPRDQRWMNRWRRSAVRNAHFLEAAKVIVSSGTNRGASKPFRVCYDDHALWPSNNYHCISAPDRVDEVQIEGFGELTKTEQLFWLVGILSSTLAAHLVLSRRSARNASKMTWTSMPLPAAVDRTIVDLIRMIIKEEQRENEAVLVHAPPLSRERVKLDGLVLGSYGNPAVLEIPRTGPDHFNDQIARARLESSVVVVGQVVEVDRKDDGDRILLYLQGIADQKREAWIPLPFELPGWALDGTPFEALIPRRIMTFRDLEDRAALHGFEHSPRAYETDDELAERLRMMEIE